MKKTALLILVTMMTLVASAQVEKRNVDTANEGKNISAEKNASNGQDISAEVKNVSANEVQLSEGMDADESDFREMKNVNPEDTLNRRIMTIPTYAMGRPYLFTAGMPLSPFGWDGGFWDIHEGLNGQVGAGVMVGFGKNNPFKGASFFSDVSLLYAKQVGKHWSVALGGTLSQFKMWNKNEIMGNVYGIGNYKFDDHWSLGIYASYNHMPEGISMFDPYYAPDMMHFNENFARIGGEVTYKFNNGNAISIGVSADVPVGNSKPWQPQHPINQGVSNQQTGNHPLK